MSLLRTSVVFGGLVFAFQYRGPGEAFVWAIAVGLAIILTLPSGLQRPGFAPYWVRIWPRRAFLTETGLATEETVKRLEEELAATDSDAYYGWYLFHGYNRQGERSFLRDGIWFTVLRPNDFDQGGLVYWNDFKAFSTSPEQTLHLEELDGLNNPIGTVEPRLYLKPVGTGLSLRLATVSGSLESVEDPSQEVALVPWAEFRNHGWWEKPERVRKRRKALLVKHGWTSDDDEDRWLGAPSELHHRYFRLQWGPI